MPDIFESAKLIVERNRFLSQMTTLGVGGRADYTVSAGSLKELSEIMRVINKNRIPFLILGRGSKILASDKGFRGVVLRLDGFKQTETDETRIIAGAGVSLPYLSRYAANLGLGGLEWACGIPASLGGAVKMNAGCYGGEMSGIIESVTVFDGKKTFDLANKDCRFGYRNSIFFENPNLIILSAEMVFRRVPKAVLEEKHREYTERRKLSQPAGIRSAGSSFKKADTVSAGELIDKCGLKGYNIGGAEISRSHANFIVNNGTATASDVEALLKLCEARVNEKFGISLTREIINIGEF